MEEITRQRQDVVCGEGGANHTEGGEVKEFGRAVGRGTYQWDVGQQEIHIYCPEDASSDAADWQSTLSYPGKGLPDKGIHIRFEFDTTFGQGANRNQREKPVPF